MTTAPPGETRSVVACRDRSWSVVTWSKADGEGVRVVPYRCRSWRHGGDCRQHAGASDFERIRAALEERERWAAVLLTVDRKLQRRRQKARARAALAHGRTVEPFSIWEVWGEVGSWWRRFRKRMQRRYGDLEYVAVLEQHRAEKTTGESWPHLHVAIRSADERLVDHIEQLGRRWRPWYETKGYDVQRRLAWERDVLQPCAVGSGFGPVCGVQLVNNPEGIAAYIVKLASEITGTGKNYQVPTAAPPNTRRLRPSRLLLPTRMRPGHGRTGSLVRLDDTTARVQLAEGGFRTIRHAVAGHRQVIEALPLRGVRERNVETLARMVDAEDVRLLDVVGAADGKEAEEGPEVWGVLVSGGQGCTDRALPDGASEDASGSKGSGRRRRASRPHSGLGGTACGD